MLTSLSRGPSRVPQTYICTACLINISGISDPTPSRQLPSRRAFSSTALGHARGGRRATRRAGIDSTRPLSRATLAALKESFMADEQKPPTGEPAAPKEESPKTSVPKEALKNANSPKKMKKSKPSHTSADNKESPSPLVEGKSTGEATKKSAKSKRAAKLKVSKTIEKRTKNAKSSKDPKPSKTLPNVNNTANKKRKSSLKVRRTLSKETFDKDGPLLAEDSDLSETRARAKLVKLIEDGSLSPSDKVKAVRSLRASLIRKFPSTGTLGHRTITEEMSIKEGMLNKPPRKVATKVRGPKAKASRRMVWEGHKRPKLVTTGPMKAKSGFDIETVDADELVLVPVDKSQPPVPKLSYGLERVLFNPGVYHLQDPRSRVFNFDPYLAKIMPVSDFDFNALKQYITSSRDETLLTTAKAEGKKYTGSTSSTTAALAHFHFLLSQWRPINTGALSQSFPVPFSTFTALQRGPSAVFLRWKNGVYAIDADKQYDTANILSMLGKSMEKLLTLSTEDFEKYRKENSDQISKEERNEAEAFNYTTIGDFLLRSQLDAYDPRLPGTGMFDLKTRAVVSIRMDTKEYEQGMGYEIRGRHGEYESFEREYYDMIRSAFLKYSLQVRMGRMDGIFVAFHNTERIFGFQYISLSEMDYALHGTDDITLGDSEFKLSLELLNRVLDKATAKYPEKSLRLHFETRGKDTPFMYIFAEPMEDKEIQQIQESNKAAVLDFEQNILGLNGAETEEEILEERKNGEWQALRAKVEESMEKDELDIQQARVYAEAMLEESGSLGDLSTEEKAKLMDELMATFDEGDDQGIEATAAGEVEDGEDEAEEDDDEIETIAADEIEDGDEEAEEDDQDIESTAADENEDDEDEIDEENEDDNEEDEDQEEDQDDEMEEDGDELTEAEDSQLEGGDTAANPDSPRVDVYESEIRVEDQVNELVDESEGGVQDEMNEQIDQQEHVEPDVVENEEPLSDEAVETDIQTAQDESTLHEIAHPEHADRAEADKASPKPEVLAMTLTIRNKVNGQYVERPIALNKEDKWTIEYSLAEVAETSRARLLYDATKRRRFLSLSNEKKLQANPWNDEYLRKLRSLSKKGREWREGQSKIDEAQGPPKVLNVKSTSIDQRSSSE